MSDTKNVKAARERIVSELSVLIRRGGTVATAARKAGIDPGELAGILRQDRPASLSKLSDIGAANGLELHITMEWRPRNAPVRSR